MACFGRSVGLRRDAGKRVLVVVVVVVCGVVADKRVLVVTVWCHRFGSTHLAVEYAPLS